MQIVRIEIQGLMAIKVLVIPLTITLQFVPDTFLMVAGTSNPDYSHICRQARTAPRYKSAPASALTLNESLTE